MTLSLWAVDAWADWIVAVSLQLLPLAIVIFVLDRLVRRAGPAVQSALWWMVVARLVIPPALAVPVIWRAAPLEGPTPVASMWAAATSSVDMTFALVVWATGVTALGCIARWRYRRVRQQCLDASAPAREDVVAIARGAADRLGLRDVPAIRIANGGGVRQPLVLGFLTPVVVLPASILDRSRLELEHVLLHELAHVRRRDPAATLICLIAQIVFWFHPVVWCARRRLATLREMACDRAVARVLGDGTSAYRRTLILLARSAATAPAAGTIGLFQRRSALVPRLELLARPVRMRRGTEWVVGIVMALGVFVSCMPRKAPAPPASAAAIELSEIPPLDQLPGSLQKRYAVMRAIALTSEKE